MLSILAWGAAARADVPPASGPSAKDTTLRYEVHDLEGKVRYGDAATCDPLKSEGWTLARKGDLLGPGIIIQVPFRSKLKLFARPAEPPTVMLFESGSLVMISDLYLKDGVATSRIQLGYGAIRAGVAEGGTRSDMQIESPVATLSKRGTDIFRFECHNGKYVMSLSDQGRGMLQAIQSNVAGYRGGEFSRFVTPGQLVTQRLMRAIENVQFNRNIDVTDQFGLGNSDKLFAVLNSRGFGFLLPAGKLPLNTLVPTPPPPPAQGTSAVAQAVLNTVVISPIQAVTSIAAGNFGIGQGNIPGIANARKRPNASSRDTSLAGRVLKNTPLGRK
jgi:hypothetical protein